MHTHVGRDWVGQFCLVVSIQMNQRGSAAHNSDRCERDTPRRGIIKI